LVTRILISHFLKIILTFPDDIGCTSSMSIICQSIARNWNKIRRIIRAVILYMIPPIILSVMWIIARMLLSINKSYPIHAIILHVGIFVSPHDQFFFCSFQSDWSNRLISSFCNINISLLLIIIFMSRINPLFLLDVG
jgi:hypothetical protein